MLASGKRSWINLKRRSAQDQRRIRAQIAGPDRVMQNQIASLDTLANSQMIVDVQAIHMKLLKLSASAFLTSLRYCRTT